MTQETWHESQVVFRCFHGRTVANRKMPPWSPPPPKCTPGQTQGPYACHRRLTLGHDGRLHAVTPALDVVRRGGQLHTEGQGGEEMAMGNAGRHTPRSNAGGVAIAAGQSIKKARRNKATSRRFSLKTTESTPTHPTRRGDPPLSVNGAIKKFSTKNTTKPSKGSKRDVTI